jgi:hypothetical protein
LGVSFFNYANSFVAAASGQIIDTGQAAKTLLLEKTIEFLTGCTGYLVHQSWFIGKLYHVRNV